MSEYWEYLDSDPGVCHGQLRFRGTRVMVYLVLDALAAGASEDEILAAYPSITREHLRAAIAYGARVAREESFVPLADEPIS